MMTFRYRFETLLNVRKIRENISQQAFSQAQRSYLSLLAMRAQIESRRDDLRHDLMNRMKGGLGSSDVKRYYDYVFHLEKSREKITENIRISEQQVNTMRVKLLEAKRAHKAVARLKEIHQARFDTFERKKEMNFIDEIAIMRHGGER
jgi:flagellar export protein FliJ